VLREPVLFTAIQARGNPQEASDERNADVVDRMAVGKRRDDWHPRGILVTRKQDSVPSAMAVTNAAND
jgi:hypothetical protein